MTAEQIKWRVKYAVQYFPFTLNTLLCAVVAWLAWHILYKPTPRGEEPSMLMPFIVIMGKMVFLLFIGIVAVSVISTIICWVHYLVLRSNKKVTLRVDFNTETKKGRKNKLFLNASLDAALRPFLGFVKGSIIYDGRNMTGQFSLLSNKRKERSIWREAITGRSRVLLPDIKEYDINGGFVYFQDMLHLFSLAVAQPISGHFYQPPILLENKDAEVSPKKTENLDVRIEQLRRVEGEYLNYKDFEAGDDVRRIVWKVYAKNRELVVRVPEMFEPYASHLYYYASFHAALKAQWRGNEYLKEMLNYYKNCVWTVYDTLSRKEWQLTFVPDQEFNIPMQADEAEKTARIVSNSQWHKGNDLQHYFNPKHGTVLCISTLTEPADLNNLLDRCDASNVIYFVKLTKVMKHFAPLNLLGRLIFLPPQDRLARLRTSWTFSPFRVYMNKREKELESMLNKSSVTWAIL